MFVTMLAWEHPYTNKNESRGEIGEKASFQVHFAVRNTLFRSLVLLLFLVKISQFCTELRTKRLRLNEFFHSTFSVFISHYVDPTC